MPFKPKEKLRVGAELKPTTTRLEAEAAETPETPEPETPEAGDAASYSEAEGSADAEHFAGFDMDPEGDFGGDPDAPEGADPEAAQGIVPFDEWFRHVFVGLFQGGGAFTGLETLKAVTEDRRDAETAARAIYETAQEVSSLRFLIQPGNKWVGRAFAVGMFALPLAGGVRAEVAAKRAARMQAAQDAKAKRAAAQRSPEPEPQPEPEPANDNGGDPLAWVANTRG